MYMHVYMLLSDLKELPIATDRSFYMYAVAAKRFTGSVIGRRTSYTGTL